MTRSSFRPLPKFDMSWGRERLTAIVAAEAAAHEMVGEEGDGLLLPESAAFGAGRTGNSLEDEIEVKKDIRSKELDSCNLFGKPDHEHRSPLPTRNIHSS